MRGSRFVAQTAPLAASASARMVRNFSITKSSVRSGRARPILSWRNTTGPGLSRRIASAISGQSGRLSARPASATTMSKPRLAAATVRGRCEAGGAAIAARVQAPWRVPKACCSTPRPLAKCPARQ